MSAKRFTLFATTSVVTGGASVLLLACFARLLPIEEYGLLGLLMSVGLVVNAVLFQWVRLYFLRHYPASSQEGRRVVLSTAIWAFALSGVVGLVAVLGLYALERALNFASPISPLLVLVLSAAQALYELVLAYARSVDDDRGFFGLSIGRAIFYLGFGALASYAVAKHSVVAMTLIAAYLLVAAVFIRRNLQPSSIKKKLSRDALVGAAQYALPMSVAVAMVALLPALSRMTVAARADDVGLAALILSWDSCNLVVSTLALSVNFVFYNRILKAHDKNDSIGLSAAFRSHVILLSALIGCSWGAALLVGDVLLRCVAGGAVAKSTAPHIPWAMFAVSLIAFRQFWFDHAFMLKRRTKFLAGLNVASVAIFGVVVLLPYRDAVTSVYVAIAISQIAVMAFGMLSEREFFKEVMHPYKPIALLVVMSLAAVVSSL